MARRAEEGESSRKRRTNQGGAETAKNIAKKIWGEVCLCVVVGGGGIERFK
jgi:hypothetical protein